MTILEQYLRVVLKQVYIKLQVYQDHNDTWWVPMSEVFHYPSLWSMNIYITSMPLIVDNVSYFRSCAPQLFFFFLITNVFLTLFLLAWAGSTRPNMSAATVHAVPGGRMACTMLVTWPMTTPGTWPPGIIPPDTGTTPRGTGTEHWVMIDTLWVVLTRPGTIPYPALPTLLAPLITAASKHRSDRSPNLQG